MSSKNNPKLSVVTITYNQEDYIRQTLESIVTQKTNFPFEVIVADDCSTDNTREIIEEYTKLYPEIVKPLFRESNLGSWQNFVSALKTAKGEYIAICEGDDYWTDQNKLHLQVEFMDKNPEFALCFHPVKVIFEKGEEPDSVYPVLNQTSKFIVYELLKVNFIQTNSVVYRSRKDYESLALDLMPGDWYLNLYHAQFGKIGFIDKVMATYRRHSGGIWWDSYTNPDSLWSVHSNSHLNFFIEISKIYGSKEKYKIAIDAAIQKIITTMIELDEKNNSSLLQEAVQLHPTEIEAFIVYQYKELLKLTGQTERLLVENKRINEEIKKMKESYRWRLSSPVFETGKKAASKLHINILREEKHE